MKDEIRNHLHTPSELEKLYRKNKAAFKQEFNSLYPSLKGNVLVECWHERLQYDSNEINWGTSREFLLIALFGLLAGFIAKIPAIFSVNEAFFYSRNIGFLFLPILTAYFALKNKLSVKHIAILFGVILACLIYINTLPLSTTSDTLVLACIHLPLLLWVILGSAFVGPQLTDYSRRLTFLKYNGDLAVMMVLILISGGIMSGLTIGLFSLIGFNIQEFYFTNVVVFGLAAIPIAGTYLIQTNPQLVSKVSPVIAKIFSPLVLIMLIIYLGAIVLSGKDPYNDREFLLLFNALLVGVMALIFFSVAESSKQKQHPFGVWVLFLLSVVTIIVNGVALSAILFRISEWGITPNRLAVLGGNLLILLNLLLVTVKLFQTVSRKSDLNQVSKAIALFLPIYTIWTIIVIFLFPVIFNFK